MGGRKISFDGWVLDRETGDLTRDGSRQRLQELPVKVLDLLLANPGRLVTREQFIAHLWPKGVVDFDTGLNTAVRKLRVALGDTADAPRYIETIPRRGYRFIGTLDPETAIADDDVNLRRAITEEATSATASRDVAPDETLPESAPPATPEPASPLPVARASGRRRGLLAAALALVLCIGVIAWLSQRPTAIPAVPAPPPPPAPQDISVAVLPFENLSAEANNEYLALGIAETILHRLSSLRDLTVIARTSSFAFKGRNDDARTIGQALNARYLVQGSMQRAGDRLRVQAQLIEAASGKQMWSLGFDRPLADVFALQDEISSRVAEQLSGSVASGRLAAATPGTAHVDAYLSYLRGRALISTGKIVDAQMAIDYFARAIQADQKFAAAYAQQSRGITRLAWLQEEHPTKDLKRAIALNDRALELDPKLGEAWVQRGVLLDQQSAGKDPARADAAFRKGLELEPSYGEGFEEYTNFLWGNQRSVEAMAMIDRARQIDPLVPRHHYLKAVMLDYSGKASPEVEALFLRALELDPTYHPALVRLGQRYSSRGEFAKALLMHERALSVEPGAAWSRGAAAETYLSLGDVAAAADVLGAERAPGSGVAVCVRFFRQEFAAGTTEAYALAANTSPFTTASAQLCAADLILRDALATRQYERALRVAQSKYAIQDGALEDAAATTYIWGLPYARLLLAKGDGERARRLLRSMLPASDQVASGNAPDPVAVLTRAGVNAVLGNRAESLDALEAGIKLDMQWFWWIAERDPIYEPLHEEPRFKALAATMAASASKQVELVAAMRARHEIPARPTSLR